MKKPELKTVMAVLRWACVALTLLLCATLILGAYGGHLDPTTHRSFYSLATLAFPFLLAANVAAGLFWVIARHWRMSLFVVAAIVLSWPTVHTVCPLNITSPHVTPAQKKGQFKVLTYNVLDFGFLAPGQDSTDPNATMEYILQQDADVVMLQEASLNADYNTMRLTRRYLRELNRKYPYRERGYHDQVILSKHPYKLVEDSVVKRGFGSADDAQQMYHFYARAYDVLVPGHTVRFINVHLQSIGLSEADRRLYVNLTRKGLDSRSELRAVKRSLVAKLASAFRAHARQAKVIRQIIDQSGENIIVCGDFNDTPASFAYRTIKGNDLHDAWVDCGFGPTYTYRQSRLWFKIDHMLYGGDMVAVESHRDRAGQSDHYPQVTTFVWKTPQQ